MGELSGTYASAEVTVDVREEGGEVAGVLVVGGQRLPLRGRWSGGALAASFVVDGAELQLRGRLEGSSLRIESDGVEHVLARQAPPRVNPLAAAVRRPAAPEGEGQIFRHPTGGEFRVPPGWSAQPSALGIQLVPPGASFGPAGPTELYGVTAQPAPGVASADDARVVAYLDQSVAQMMPGARRAGAPEPAGKGLRLRWSARNPMTGAEVGVLSLVALLRGMAVAVVGIAEAGALERRRAALEGVFTSLSWGQGERDPALVGVWHQWSYSSSGGYSGSSHSAETRRVVVLGADGGAAMRSSTETSASLEGRDGYGNPSWSAGIAGQGGSERAGTWSAGGGMLYLIWSDGTSASWQYQVAGPPGGRTVTLLAPGAAKPEQWTERA